MGLIYNNNNRDIEVHEKGGEFTKELLVKNATLIGFAVIFVGLIQVVYNVVIGKTFGASILGQVNLGISVAILFSLVISTFVENTATKFLSEFSAKKDEKKVDYTFKMLQKWTITGCIILVIIAFIFSGFISSKIKLSEELFLIGLPLIFLIGTHHFYRGCFLGLNKVDKYSKFEVISSLAFFVILGMVAFIWKQALLLPFIVFYGLFSIFSIFNLKGYLKRDSNQDKDPFKLRKKIGTYGVISMVGVFASTSKAHIANIFTGGYLSPEQVGFYSAAVSITIILQFVPSIMGRVLLPSMSYSYGKNDIQTIKRILNKTTLWLSIIALLLGGIFIILSEKILTILFTSEFTIATFSLQTLIIGACLLSIIVPAVSVLCGTKYVQIPNIAGVIGLLTSLALWPYLIPKFGIDGTAIGYIMGVFIASIIPLYYARKYFGLELKKNSFVVLTTAILLAIAIYAKKFVGVYPDLVMAGVFAIVFITIFRRDIFEIYTEIKPKLPTIGK
jgi:putative peptidoglycan lipid II flippase